MRYIFFLHYGWFLQNFGKHFIRTNMHATVDETSHCQILSRRSNFMPLTRMVLQKLAIFPRSMFISILWIKLRQGHLCMLAQQAKRVFVPIFIKESEIGMLLKQISLHFSDFFYYGKTQNGKNDLFISFILEMALKSSILSKLDHQMSKN